MGNSRKYSYHTTDRFHTLTCPFLKNFKNGLSPPQCPCNYIIINPPSLWIFFFVKPFGIPSRVHKYAHFGAFTSCTGQRWSKTKEQTPWNNFSLNRKQRGPVQRTPPCPRNSEKPSMAWYGYFQESPNKKKNRSRDNQTTNQETLLKMNLCQWPLLHKEHFCYPKGDTFTCFDLSTHPRVTVLGWGGRGTKHSELLQGHPTIGRSKYCLDFSVAWGRQRSFQSCMLFEAYLINSIKIFHVYLPRLGYNYFMEKANLKFAD